MVVLEFAILFLRRHYDIITCPGSSWTEEEEEQHKTKKYKKIIDSILDIAEDHMAFEMIM